MKNSSHDDFVFRHIGPSKKDTENMLKVLGVKSLDELIDQTIPSDIAFDKKLNIPEADTEFEYLEDIWEIAKKNKLYDSYIGLGYYNCIVPSVISRNILENPGWYTQYTPYQAEISQGRLEALLNFQTVSVVVVIIYLSIYLFIYLFTHFNLGLYYQHILTY